MKKNIKKIAYSIIGRFTRTRLFWFFNVCKFIKNGKLLILRAEGQFLMAKIFNNYLDNLELEKQQEIKKDLEKNLDQASIEEIDHFIERQKYIYTHNIIDQFKLFTKLELGQQKECSKKIKSIAKEMSRYQFSFLPSESFYGLNGLKWLPEKIKEQLKNGIFIDAGAYEGDSAIILEKEFTPSHVYAFEPEDRNFEILKNNCALTKNKIITPIKLGLADQEGKAYVTNEGCASSLSYDKNDQEIELVSLDEFLKTESSNQKVSLIKMDIEGAEMSALHGAEETIKRHKPILAICIYHKPEDFFLIKPWLEEICPEYKYIIVKASPFSLIGEVTLIAYV